jgi:hypothetical protein
MQIRFTEKGEGANLEHGVGADVVQLEIVEHHELAEEFRPLHGQPALDMRGEEHEITLTGSRHYLFSGSLPYSFFLLGQEADSGESSEISDRGVGTLPDRHHLVAARFRVTAGSRVPGLHHRFDGRWKSGATKGARARAYGGERKNRKGMEN